VYYQDVTTASHDPGGALTCTECDASVPLPEDLEALSARCPYCGNENLLPRDVARARQARAARQREEAARAARAARQEARAARSRRSSRLAVIGVIVLVLLVAAAAGIAVNVTMDRRSRDPASTGMAAVQGLLPLYRGSGCTHVVIEPTVCDGTTSYTLKMKRSGQCIDLIAATGAARGRLSLSLTTPLGKRPSPPPPGPLVHLTHCARVDGVHQARVEPANRELYTFVALDCPRPLLDPRPRDPRSTGQAAVAARMKQLYARGCRHIVHPAERLDTGIRWVPKLANSHNANCLHVLVMTGARDNALTVTMKTPFGEQVALPGPGPVIDFRYCSRSGGPHPITITPSTDAFYTFAAVDCPRGAKRRRRPR
jgi:hypothetical protein